MASASVRPSFRTRCFRTMNGTLVLRAACATVANCSALSNPAAATSMRAPRLRTGLSRSCNRGSDAAILTEDGADADVEVEVLGAELVRVVLAPGVLARVCVDAADAGAFSVATVAGETVVLLPSA